MCLYAVADQAPRDYSGSCTASGCHDGFAKLKVVHNPISAESCDECHEPAPGAKPHAFKLKAAGADLCTECHDAFEGKHKHAPAADGDCMLCHDPHASAHAGLLRNTQQAVCGDCHDDVAAGRKYLHGPFAAGACTGCHDAHASDRKALLSAPIREACLKCHDAMGQRLASPAKVHAPVSGDCTDCHDAHGADNAMMTTVTGSGLCLNCHDDILDALNGAKVGHSAVTAGAGCAACHDAHAANNAKLLRGGEQEMCQSCHDKAIDAGGRRLMSIAKELAENPMHHGPIGNGECTPCHGDVHGGNRFRLLAAAYPASMYVPYADEEYALCFECHDADAFADAETQSATGFRNGKQNLHHLHVSRETKGRSCRACHAVHASKQPHLIAESVPFGAWQIPIGFKAATDGGSCAPGCHRPYRYERTAAVVNVTPTPSPSDS
jgi:predicted CXXCH cytochrome family protein